MKWLDFSGNIADLFSLGLDLKNWQTIARLGSLFTGRKTASTAGTPTKESEPLQAAAGGKGYADEVLLLLALTELVDAEGRRVRDRKLSPADFGVFLEILSKLNDAGRTNAANMLVHIVGFKGTIETIKVPKGTREVGKGANKKTETVYGEHQRDINPSGAKILVFFGEVGADKAIELLNSSHILDNLEDKTRLAAKDAKEALGKFVRENAQSVEEMMAAYCLGPQGFKRALQHASVKPLREAAEAEAGPALKAEKVKLYLEALDQYVERKTKAAGRKQTPTQSQIWGKRLTWGLVLAIAVGVVSCSAITTIQHF